MTSPRRPSLDELAAGRLDAADAAAMAQLAELYTTLDPVPDGLVDRISFGITLDALQAEVEVALLERSRDLVGARSDTDTDTQTVTFSSSELTTMVTITVLSPELVRIDGWIAAGGGVQVEMHSSGGELTAIADANGRFAFDDVRRGPLQFLLRSPAALNRKPVVTPTITV